VGLPPAAKNASTWPLKKLLLGNPALKPSPALIADTHAFTLALLRVRYSSPLFRLRTATAICSQVRHARRRFVCRGAMQSHRLLRSLTLTSQQQPPPQLLR